MFTPMPLGKNLFHLTNRGSIILMYVKVLIDLYDEHVDAVVDYCDKYVETKTGTTNVDMIQAFRPWHNAWADDSDSSFASSSSSSSEETTRMVSHHYMEEDPYDSPHRNDGLSVDSLVEIRAPPVDDTLETLDTTYPLSEPDSDEFSIDTTYRTNWINWYHACEGFEIEFGSFGDAIDDYVNLPPFGKLDFEDKVVLMKAKAGEQRLCSASMKVIKDAFLKNGKPSKAEVTLRLEVIDTELPNVDRHIFEAMMYAYDNNDIMSGRVVDHIDFDRNDDNTVLPRNVIPIHEDCWSQGLSYNYCR